MKHALTTWRFKLASVAVIAGAFLVWIAIQQTNTPAAYAGEKATVAKPALQQLKASGKTPPELQMLEDAKALPTTERARPTKNELLNKVAAQPGGKDRVQKALAGKQGETILQASTSEPPEMKQLKETKALPTKERVRPTRSMLLDKVARQPGGQEKLKMVLPKELKSGKAPFASGFSLTFLSELNPFKAGVAHAAPPVGKKILTPVYKKSGDANASTETAVVLTPSELYKTSPFQAEMEIYGVLRSLTCGPNVAWLNNLNLPSGTKIYKPCVRLDVNIPSSGWYMINFETYRGTKSTLKYIKFNGWSWVYDVIQTWDERNNDGYTDHPALVNLSTGWHSFYWIMEPETNGGRSFYRVSIEKIDI